MSHGAATSKSTLEGLANQSATGQEANMITTMATRIYKVGAVYRSVEPNMFEVKSQDGSDEVTQISDTFAAKFVHTVLIVLIVLYVVFIKKSAVESVLHPAKIVTRLLPESQKLTLRPTTILPALRWQVNVKGMDFSNDHTVP